MLLWTRLPSRPAVKAILDHFDPETTTWIVSDLRSKIELQRHFLRLQGYHLDDSVLRVSDFWKLVLKRLHPEFRIVSRDFVTALVRAHLERYKKDLGVSAASVRSVLTAMDRFAGLIFHPRGDEAMRDWFENQPEARDRWQVTYFVARHVLAELRSKSILLEKWIPSVLQGERRLAEAWSRPLIVDLGAEMSGPEAQLFHELSRGPDVRVLEPSPKWADLFSHRLRPYEDIRGGARDVPIPAPNTSAGQREVWRLSGPLAEVKAAVSLARRWVEEGVSPEAIGIVAPKIEEYWPILRPFLEEEGLPFQKAVTVKLSTLPAVHRWCALLKTRRGEITPGDLETGYFRHGAAGNLRLEEFRSLFTSIYGPEDLARHQDVEAFFRQGPKFTGSLRAFAFLLSAGDLWDSRDPDDALIVIARELLGHSPGDLELPAEEWIRYVESVAAAKEWTLRASNEHGLFVDKILSAHGQELRRRIFLGLSEEGLRSDERRPLPRRDLEGLLQLGFHLESDEQSLVDFEVRWLAEGGSDVDVFSVGLSTMEGSVRTPSALWLEFAGSRDEHLDLPGATRWDEIQSRPDADPRDRGTLLLGRLDERIEMDFGRLAPAPAPWTGELALSPSQVKLFHDCPFKWSAEKFFRLRTVDEVDMDASALQTGNLIHRVFQRMTDEAWIARDSSDQEILDLIESAGGEDRRRFGEPRFWEAFKLRQLAIAKRFLDVEKRWSREYPRLKILPAETEWAIWMDPQTGVFSTNEIPGGCKLSGRIDRLETDGEERYVVLDYKGSTGSLENHPKWIDANDLQLLFYMWALEHEAIKEVRGRVIGAFYYSYRDFRREKGLQIESEAGTLYPPAHPKHQRRAEESHKAALFGALENRVRSMVAEIQAGRWKPEPRETRLCGDCEWRSLCRAPHLN